MTLGWLLRWWEGRRRRWRWWWGERRRLRWREGAVVVEVLLERAPACEELLVSWREGDGRPVGPHRLPVGSAPLLIGATGRIEVIPIPGRWLAFLGLLVGAWFLWPFVVPPSGGPVASDAVVHHPTAGEVPPSAVRGHSQAELRARARAAERAAYYRPGALAESVSLWERLAAQGGPEAATAAAHARRLAHVLAARLAALEGAIRWAERTRRWRAARRLAARMRLEAPPGSAFRRWAERHLGGDRPGVTR